MVSGHQDFCFYSFKCWIQENNHQLVRPLSPPLFSFHISSNIYTFSNFAEKGLIFFIFLYYTGLQGTYFLFPRQNELRTFRNLIKTFHLRLRVRIDIGNHTKIKEKDIFLIYLTKRHNFSNKNSLARIS